jgi:glutamate 5-kinase
MRRPAGPEAPVVVKIGSSSLAPDGNGLDDDAIRRVADQVEALWKTGRPTVLVTSGAVAAGVAAMDMSSRPTDLPGLQAAAAVGQGALMESYANEFGRRGRRVGQVLLTRDVLANRSQYLNARETLMRLIHLEVVPIVNENDTVVVDELKLGDNDRLAAVVAHLVGAGMLVILSDIEGLYAEDPRFADDPELLSAIGHTDAVLDELRLGSGAGSLGSGGVATKVAAARMAAWSGIPTVVASATAAGAAVRAAAGEAVGTWVEPHASGLTARKLWVAFGLPSLGRITIDSGAVEALTSRGGSLLAAGVVAVDGEFPAGAAVEVLDADGTLVGKGLVRFGANDLEEARGQHSSVAGGEVIHRDDLVVLR